MPQKSFDDVPLRRAMTGYLEAAEAFDQASQVGAEARTLLDLAEAKAVAGMQLRKRLVELGWSEPEAQRTTT
ncbi:MAG: hypothetical protein WD794_03150 [Mycobacteriales bacterium]